MINEVWLHRQLLWSTKNHRKVCIRLSLTFTLQVPTKLHPLAAGTALSSTRPAGAAELLSVWHQHQATECVWFSYLPEQKKQLLHRPHLHNSAGTHKCWLCFFPFVYQPDVFVLLFTANIISGCISLNTIFRLHKKARKLNFNSTFYIKHFTSRIVLKCCTWRKTNRSTIKDNKSPKQ